MLLKDPMLFKTSKRLPNKKRRTGKTYNETWYSKPDCHFVESHTLGHRVFLLLPLFRVPVDLDDRKKLLSGQDTSKKKFSTI
jgi:hypothetical protein